MFESRLELFLEDNKLPPSVFETRKKRIGAKGSRAKRPRIIVVDDHRTIADSLTDILNGAGFRATGFYDGLEALRIAQEVHPEFVLTDVMMPAMNGVDLAIAIRQCLPATKIILLSGQAGIANLLAHGRAQGYEFELIAKPVHPDKLLERLKQLARE